jgi:uncharacterized protein involved in exopolysaccharide biosynthesis
MLERTSWKSLAAGSGSKHEDVGFAEAIDVLVQNARSIGKYALGGIGAGLLYLLMAQPSYRADAQIVIDPRGLGVMRDSSGEVGNTLDSSQIETHIVALKSRAIAEAVIGKLKLQDDPEFQGGASGGLPALLGRKPDDPNRFLDPAVVQFRDNLRVGRVGISYAIEVAFYARDPQKAARIANATAEAYLQSLIDVRADSARAASEWLEDRILHLRVQMNAAARRLQQFRASQDYRIVNKNRETEAKPDPAQQAKEPVTLEELELTADTYRKAYQQFYTAFTEAVQRESYPASNVRIVSKASVPTQKSSPRTSLVLALGATLGGLVGLGFAIARTARDRLGKAAA